MYIHAHDHMYIYTRMYRVYMYIDRIYMNMSNEHLFTYTAVVYISMSPRKQSALGVGKYSIGYYF